MFVLRPIKASDTDAFVQLAFEAGLGLLSLPKNPELLAELVHDSENAFAKKVKTPGPESYLFVLENILDNAIGGVCGIHAKTGVNSPSVFFHIERTTKFNPILGQQNEMQSLKVVQYRNGPSEICSLFLGHHFRHSGLGRLLSLSRLLFIATCLERFDTMIFADMRGVVENNTHCPFWNGVGKYFLNMDYVSLMQIKNVKNFTIIDMLPESPIYIPLLPQDVQQAIGKVHENTKPALNMLMQQGFCITDDVSVFDGGPRIEAETKDLYAVKNSIVTTVAAVTSTLSDDSSYLICNNKIDFRCCYGQIILGTNHEATISTNVAAALHVDKGDTIRFIQHHAGLA